MSSQLRSVAHLNAYQRPTVGDTKTSAVNYDHIGWLLCDGRPLPISDFRILYNVIGNAYGSADEGYFRLPNASGRVIGNVGNADVSGETWYAGDISGEETHVLTIAEMPAHNHGTNSSDSIIGNNLTGISGEHIHGITDPMHNHDITDPGHSHSYFNQPEEHQVAVSLTTTGTADNVNINQTTGPSTTGITINNALTNITINPNGNHQHTIKTQGGDDPHNNMQPTLFFGNLFIYCGKPRVGTSPNYNAFPPTFTKKIY